MRDRFENAFVDEKIILTFDFLDELATGETLAGTPTVTVSVIEGVDAAPAELLNGAAAIVGAAVLVPVDPTVSGVDYRIKVLVSTSNPQKVLACVGRLYVEP